MDLTTLSPELEDLIKCSCCHLPFNDNDAVPKLFDCRHYFCLKCVNSMLREANNNSHNNNINSCSTIATATTCSSESNSESSSANSTASILTTTTITTTTTTTAAVTENSCNSVSGDLVVYCIHCWKRTTVPRELMVTNNNDSATTTTTTIVESASPTLSITSAPNSKASKRTPADALPTHKAILYVCNKLNATTTAANKWNDLLSSHNYQQQLDRQQQQQQQQQPLNDNESNRNNGHQQSKPNTMDNVLLTNGNDGSSTNTLRATFLAQDNSNCNSNNNHNNINNMNLVEFENGLHSQKYSRSPSLTSIGSIGGISTGPIVNNNNNNNIDNDGANGYINSNGVIGENTTNNGHLNCNINHQSINDNNNNNNNNNNIVVNNNGVNINNPNPLSDNINHLNHNHLAESRISHLNNARDLEKGNENGGDQNRLPEVNILANGNGINGGLENPWSSANGGGCGGGGGIGGCARSLQQQHQQLPVKQATTTSATGTAKIGENCLIHAMPNTLWCNTCHESLCRGCAAGEEHRTHIVKNQVEAKEFIQNEIKQELNHIQTMYNSVQHLMLKQRTFLARVYDNLNGLKTHIETILLNHRHHNGDASEHHETMAKYQLCIELLNKQTPREAMSLYASVQSEKKRLTIRCKELLLQCKLDEFLAGNYLCDFTNLKQFVTQMNQQIKDNSFTASTALTDGAASNASPSLSSIEVHSTNQQIAMMLKSTATTMHQLPQSYSNLDNNSNGLFLLANYCINQLYNNHNKQANHLRQRVLLQQQIQQQQQQQQTEQLQQQQRQHFLIQQQQQQQYHQQQQQQQQYPSVTVATSAARNDLFLETILSNASNMSALNSYKMNNNNNNGNNTNGNINGSGNGHHQSAASYAQALQQNQNANHHTQQQQQHHQHPVTQAAYNLLQQQSYADVALNRRRTLQHSSSLTSSNNTDSISTTVSNTNCNLLSNSILSHSKSGSSSGSASSYPDLLSTAHAFLSMDLGAMATNNNNNNRSISSILNNNATSTSSGSSITSSASSSSSNGNSCNNNSSVTAMLSQFQSGGSFFYSSGNNDLNGLVINNHHHSQSQQQTQNNNNNNNNMMTTSGGGGAVGIHGAGLGLSSTVLGLGSNCSSATAQLLLNPSTHIYPMYYFNLEINGQSTGRILIEVRCDVAPKMAKNFDALVNHELGYGYKGCQIFQCWENESIITGDFDHNNGRGGRSVYDEGYFMPDDTKILATRGAVGMRRSQRRHDNLGLVGSQFRIILREMRCFTGIFAFVVEGLDLIDRISQTGDTSGKPKTNIVIVNCGKYQLNGI